MKRRNTIRIPVFYPVFAFFLILGSSSPAQSRFGLFYGLPGKSLNSDTPDSIESKLSGNKEYAAGFLFESDQSSALQMVLAPMVIKKNMGNQREELDLLIHSSLSTTSIELPLLLKLSLNRSGINPYLLGGGAASYLLDAEERFSSDFGKALYGETADMKEEIKDFTFSWTAGCGLSLPLGPLNLFVEGRYSKGLGNIFETEGLELIPEGYQFLGGITFNIGQGGVPEIEEEVKLGEGEEETGDEEKPGTREREEDDEKPVEKRGSEEGSGPEDTPIPNKEGEEAGNIEPCPLDIDIFVPAAQDVYMPRVAETLDASQGAWTIRNDDIDSGNPVPDRLIDQLNLLKVEGRPDLEMPGEVPGENDLVKIELINPALLPNVWLCAYAIAHEDGRRQLTATKITTNRNGVKPRSVNGKLQIWRNADRTVAVTLPHKMPAQQSEILWVEGLKAGRYRLVLFQDPSGNIDPADVQVTEPGPIHGREVNANIETDPVLTCLRNVRLTVCMVDIRQATTPNKREHVFDMLWGGRPIFDGDVWPGGGVFAWGQSEGLPGSWISGTVEGHPNRRVEVHNVRLPRNNEVPEGYRSTHRICGAFEHEITPVGAAAIGSGLYDQQIELNYAVEGVRLERKEPVTLMVPHHVTVTGGSLLGDRFAQDVWGRSQEVKCEVTYHVFTQNDRSLVGPRNNLVYEKRYGSRLQMYEALGMGINAVENDDQVQVNYQSSSNPESTFSFNIQTRQRSKALPDRGSLHDSDFQDNFSIRINSGQRDMIIQDILDNAALAGLPFFSLRQDVVALISNGQTQYDVRVARDQLLEILRPERDRRGRFGGIGLRLTLGGAGGTQLRTGSPDRISDTHNP